MPRAAFNVSNSCYFKFLSPTYQPNQIVTAQLGIYLRSRYGSVPPTGGSVQHLVVRRNQRRQQSGDRDFRRRKIINGSNPHHFGRWHFFEAKAIVQSWISHPERNIGITVTVADASLQSLVVVQPRRPDEETLVGPNIGSRVCVVKCMVWLVNGRPGFKQEALSRQMLGCSW